MLERLENELQNWLSKLEYFLIELSGKKISAGFFDKKAEIIINEYWEILQIIYDEDVLPEMQKQGYDADQEDKIPKSVWAAIVPKLKPILAIITKDASDLLETYRDHLKKLNPATIEDLYLIETTSVDDILVMFDTIIKEK